MATTFTLNRDQIIASALRVIGVYSSEAGETPTSTEFSNASDTLNLIVKALQNDGLHLWALKQVTIPLVADKQSYTLGIGGDVNISRPPKIDTVIYRDSSGSEDHDRPIEIIARERYWNLAAKNSKGAPVSAYYDPQLDLGVLYLWPVAETVTNRSVILIYQKPFEDLDTSSAEFDFPQRYLNPLKWLLAEELAYEYGIPSERLLLIKARALEAKTEAMWYDQEQGSLYVVPEQRWYRG